MSRRGIWTPDQLFAHYNVVLAARDEDTERTRAQMEIRLDEHNDLLNRFVTRAELAAAEARLRASIVALAAVVASGAAVVALFR